MKQLGFSWASGILLLRLPRLGPESGLAFKINMSVLRAYSATSAADICLQSWCCNLRGGRCILGRMFGMAILPDDARYDSHDTKVIRLAFLSFTDLTSKPVWLDEC
jgi:hypothetical protein